MQLKKEKGKVNISKQEFEQKGYKQLGKLDGKER